MRTLGVLGGMSWESTAVYYRLLNQGVAARRGGLHSAPLLLASVDFAGIAELQSAGRWDEAADRLGALGAGLRAAGAEALLIATNTMHCVAAQVSARAGLPLLHIVDATAAGIRAAGPLRRIGLIGTRFTMEQSFYVERLRERHGIEAIVPCAPDRAEVHRVIFEELCRGTVSGRSRAALLAVIDRLAAAGAQGVILGCTELMLLLDPATLPVPGFDSTALHAQRAVEWMLAPAPVPHELEVCR